MKSWALVTGAAKRIGRVIALELAHAGWNVIVHYQTSQKEAEHVAHEIEKLGVKACLAEIDLTNTSLVEKLIPSLIDGIGPISALINNAAIFETDTHDADGKRHMSVNYTAPRLLSEALHQHQAKGSQVSIVNILDADPTQPSFRSYNKSKIALQKLVFDQALRFAPQTRVNGVALGPIIKNPRESKEHFQSLVTQSPLKYATTPEEVALAVRFLLENLAITGNILYADSGMHLKRASSR